MKKYNYITLLLLFSTNVFGQFDFKLNSSNIYNHDIIYNNPASISIQQSLYGSFEYQQLYTGFNGDDFRNYSTGIVYPLNDQLAVGLRNKYFSANIFRQEYLSFMFAHRLFDDFFSYGLNLNLLNYSYNKDKFKLEHYDDPLLSKGTSKNAFSVGVGIYLNPFWWLILGASADHVNQPDISIDDNTYKKEPIYKLSASFPYFPYIPQIDFKKDEQGVIFQSGVSRYLGNHLNLFLGFDKGGSERSDLLFETNIFYNNLNFSYSYCEPIGSVSQVLSGSHRISINFSKDGIVPPPFRPFIELNYDKYNDVYSKQTTLSGKIANTNGLNEIKIIKDGEQIYQKHLQDLTVVSLTHDVVLDSGRNNLEVIAFSKKGKMSKQIVLNYIPTSSGSYLTQLRHHDYWAVIVGISEYIDTQIPQLKYAAKDAEEFYKWLISADGGRYDPGKIKLLLNEKATLYNIKDALSNWLGQAIEEDMVIIYFAGHGGPQSPTNMENMFLYPYDAEWDNIAATGFGMWEIEDAIERFIKANSLIVIADACHSAGVGGTFNVGLRGVKINPINQALIGIGNIRENVCVISASDKNQFSQESEIWGGGHGVFTYFLLEGLKGKAENSNPSDNTITIGEMVPYLSTEVRKATKNDQTPIISGSYDPSIAIKNLSEGNE